MELRDYLMPGEYILAVVKKIDATGNFRNLAVTNKRFILFNTKRKMIPFGKDKEEISNMHSIVFENSPAIQILENEERVEISICRFFNRDLMKQVEKNGETYYCSFAYSFSIYTTFNGPSLSEISSMIREALRPLIKRELIGNRGKEWKSVSYLLFREDR
ncbi:hypothetical protein A3L09_03005 [Thermococcus profundus]|uniref:Uncharacterized protein n=1 Tax=Thermococcus profundus TaxID=49899 RepID=A0A2Z2MIP6_THEPR|nr:hypothetical protein [Thermococcus profundus]ASJ02301.1 hypothetical protein A3L09_03005 [Thermococcus profundus]